MNKQFASLCPYSPAVGAPPPYLAGRERLMLRLKMGLDMLHAGRATHGLMVYGMRGVGKTAILMHMANKVNEHGNGILTVATEVGNNGVVIDALLQGMHEAVLEREKLLGLELAALDFYRMGKRHLEWQASGDRPAADGLVSEFKRIGKELKKANLAFIILIDEFHELKQEELKELMAVVNLAQSQRLPFMFVVAGLLNLPHVVGKSRTNAERLFSAHKIGWLTREQARLALSIPAEENGRFFEPEAIDLILDHCKGYPYFLQIWGGLVWEIAKGASISLADVKRALPLLREEVEAFMFESRLGKMTPNQLEYALAMARLPLRDRTTARVAAVLGGDARRHSKTRIAMINKGLIHAPEHARLDFTMPMFDDILLDRQR